jgi:hypothetical protein
MHTVEGYLSVVVTAQITDSVFGCFRFVKFSLKRLKPGFEVIPQPHVLALMQK